MSTLRVRHPLTLKLGTVIGRKQVGCTGFYSVRWDADGLVTLEQADYIILEPIPLVQVWSKGY